MFDFIRNVLENNNLIPAWSELPEVKSLIRLKPKEESEKPRQPYDEIKLFEKAGKLKFKLHERKFFLEFEVVIPMEYPYKKPTVKFLGHNYDVNFARIFNAGCDQLVRRLWEGGEPGYIPGTKSDINKGKIGNKKNVGVLASELDKLKVLSR